MTDFQKMEVDTRGSLDEDIGARPLRRKITSAIEDMLSRKIVEGDLRSGYRAEVAEQGGAFDVLIFQDTKSG